MSHASSDEPFSCLQAVVMDWAGTTVDFGCQGPVQAFVECFAAFGVEVTVAEAREPMGMGKREHVAAMCAMPRIADAWRTVHGAPPSVADIDRIYKRVESVMVEVIQRYSVPMPGVVDAVAAMRRQGLRIGSCTGYPRSVGEILAERAREFGYEPDVLVCATDVSHGRPEPDMCLKALKDMNLQDPARAVKIGDTVNDVLEGLRAGMWVIGLTLSGSLAGLTEEELRQLPEAQKWLMHDKISDLLANAGAHFTAPDLPSCLSILSKIDEHCQNNYTP